MPVVFYILIAYGWTWLTVLPLLLDKRGITAFGVPDWWQAVGAFGPALAALVIAARCGGPTEVAVLRAGLRRWRVGARGVLLGIVSPLAFLLVAIIAMTIARGAPDFGVLGSGKLATTAGLADLLLVDALLQALGEEPGWRGWLLPRLRERFGPGAATAVLFPLWLFWHLPFFLCRPDFGIGQFFGFALGIASASVWLTLIRETTRSTLLAVTWHALLNITRGIALAISVPMFLGYGMVVTVGAIGILVFWWRRPDRD